MELMCFWEMIDRGRKISFGFPSKHTLLVCINSLSNLFCLVLAGYLPHSGTEMDTEPQTLSPSCDGAGVCFYLILKVVRAAEKKVKQEDIML